MNRQSAPCPAHILVVDDDDRIRALLKKYLSSNGFLVSAAADAREAEKLLASIAFDLAVVDRMMPGKDGVRLVRDMRSLGLQMPAIMLTAVSDVESRIDGLASGADDYLPKPFEPKELLLRINNILRRARGRASRSAIAVGDGSYDHETGIFSRGDKPIKLTSGEKTVMNLLAAASGGAVGRDELAAASGGTERGVDVAIARIRRKIEIDAKLPGIILTVRNKGYRIVT